MNQRNDVTFPYLELTNSTKYFIHVYNWQWIRFYRSLLNFTHFTFRKVHKVSGSVITNMFILHHSSTSTAYAEHDLRNTTIWSNRMWNGGGGISSKNDITFWCIESSLLSAPCIANYLLYYYSNNNQSAADWPTSIIPRRLYLYNILFILGLPMLIIPVCVVMCTLLYWTN